MLKNVGLVLIGALAGAAGLFLLQLQPAEAPESRKVDR